MVPAYHIPNNNNNKCVKACDVQRVKYVWISRTHDIVHTNGPTAYRSNNELYAVLFTITSVHNISIYLCSMLEIVLDACTKIKKNRQIPIVLNADENPSYINSPLYAQIHQHTPPPPRSNHWILCGTLAHSLRNRKSHPNCYARTSNIKSTPLRSPIMIMY